MFVCKQDLYSPLVNAIYVQLEQHEPSLASARSLLPTVPKICLCLWAEVSLLLRMPRPECLWAVLQYQLDWTRVSIFTSQEVAVH